MLSSNEIFHHLFAILSFSLSEHGLKDNLFIFGIKKAFLFDYFYATSVEIDTLFFFYFHIKPSFHLKVIIWNQFTLDFDWMAFFAVHSFEKLRIFNLELISASYWAVWMAKTFWWIHMDRWKMDIKWRRWN